MTHPIYTIKALNTHMKTSNKAIPVTECSSYWSFYTTSYNQLPFH